MKNISIIGYGRFGKILKELFGTEFKYTIYDLGFTKDDYESNPEFTADLEEVYAKTQDLIIFAVPINKFEQVIQKHKEYFLPQHILIDVLSVKMHPKAVFDNELTDSPNEILLTHPMFGPDSAKDGFKGLKIVLDKYKSSDKTYSKMKDLFADKGLEIVELEANEHDMLAANSQGVTHFLGRLLSSFSFKETKIDTNGAKSLLKVMKETCNDTFELFWDLQQYNPHTKDMRLRLGKAYDAVYGNLLPERINKDIIVFGIQGGQGSFNEQALSQYVDRHGIENYKTVYLYSTENVLKALHRGEIDYGQFATHNSIGGIVTETVHAIGKYRFEIVEEFGIEICHFLMKSKQSHVNDIDTIMTHPQVLKQCKNNLQSKYPKMKKTCGKGELIDHARVAKEISKNRLGKNIAVMGPEVLSSIYNLDIIEGNLQDQEDNLTSFLIVERIRPKES